MFKDVKPSFVFFPVRKEFNTYLYKKNYLLIKNVETVLVE